MIISVVIALVRDRRAMLGSVVDAALALILGGVSYQKMRVDIFPEIKLPSILVTTFYRGLSPSEMEGAISFRLYRPGDKRCRGKPVFSGGTTVDANGSYSLGTYLATRPGIYRLSVGYSGDPRNAA